VSDITKNRDIKNR